MDTADFMTLNRERQPAYQSVLGVTVQADRISFLDPGLICIF